MLSILPILFFSSFFLITQDIYGLSQPDTQKMLEGGIKAYQDKNYPEAYINFDKLLKLNPKDKNILYNMGLLKYKQKEIGESLGYLNLAFANGNSKALKVMQTIQRDHPEILIPKLNLKTKFKNYPSWIFSLFVFLSLALLSNKFFNCFLKEPNFLFWRTFKKNIFYALVFCLALCVFIIKINQSLLPTAISKNVSKVYASSSIESASVLDLKMGQEVLVLNKKADWVWIKFLDKKGWVLAEDLFLNSP